MFESPLKRAVIECVAAANEDVVYSAVPLDTAADFAAM
jgi:hypothetical protein